MQASTTTARIVAFLAACASLETAGAQCYNCGCDRMDYFRSAIAIDGERAVAGAYDVTEASSRPGSAYVIENTEDGWLRSALVTAGDGTPGDGFAAAVDLAGDTILIGAYLAHTGSSHAGGAAYVFENEPERGWVETAKLEAADTSTDDWFGSSVALSGDRALLGAHGHDGAGTESGSAYVFARVGHAWAEAVELVAPDAEERDLFGYSVALDADVALIGAPGDGGHGARTGSVRVFERGPGGWSQVAALEASDGAPDDMFGASVAIAGATLIVGAPGDDEGPSNAGSAYVFQRAGATWVETAKLRAPDPEASAAFGSVVRIAGERVLAGTPGDAADTGAAYLFERGPAGWSQVAKLFPLDGQPGERFSFACDMDGSRAVAGTQRPVCAAFVYDLEHVPRTWFVDAASTPPGSGTETDPYTSLQYAIRRPATRAGDRILVAAGVYADATVNFLGKDLHVRSLAGPAATTIVAPPAGAVGAPAIVFANGESESAVLDGFTITGGTAGGLVCRGASPVVRDCVITGNEGVDGGGVYAELSGVELVDCVINANGLGAARGGGLFFTMSGAKVTRCEIMGNGAPGSTRGGGVYLEHQGVLFRECSVSDNHGAQGAGVFIRGTPPAGPTVFRQCTLSDNASSGDGGGLYLESGSAVLRDTLVMRNTVSDGRWGGGLSVDGGELTCERTVVSDNSAGHGGGAHVEVGTALFRECTFTGNVAQSVLLRDGAGGGLGCEVPTVTVEHSVLAGNRALGNSLAAGRGGAVHGPATLVHCTLTANAAAGGGSGAWDAALASCIVWDDDLGGAASAVYSDVQGGFPGAGNLDTDPWFWSPQAYDLHLLPGSPCIDAGSPSGPPDPDGSRADMGAFPFSPSYCGPPGVYCSAKPSSLGCVPAIGSSGAPTLSGPDDFHVTATDVLSGQFGFLIWGRAAHEQPLFGGTLCVGPPFARTAIQATGGGPGPSDCSGSLSYHFSQQALSSLGPYGSVFTQWWYRDPGFAPPEDVGLTAGLHFVLCP